MNLFAIALAALCIASCHGLKCWECENAMGNEECMKRGKWRICDSNEDSCQIEMRHGGWGLQMMVSKRCKQSHACQNNNVQNNRKAWEPSQCNLKSPSSVCRCCCQTDECNLGLMSCWEKAKTCPTKQVAPKNGAVTCSDGSNIGSNCEFSCSGEYILTGAPTTTCNEDAKWSNAPPTCQRRRCPPGPGRPRNGGTVCTDGNFIGSECEFYCDRYHERVGELYSACVENEDSSITWDRPVPVCRPIRCDDEGKLSHGEMECTKDNFATSTCTYRCTEDHYDLYPKANNEVYSRTCRNNTEWDKPKPCCARPCPRYAIMDFVVILDSSSSVGAENWIKMKGFVRSFLSEYELGPESSYYSVFRYNGEVDTDTQILFKDYPSDIEALFEAFDAIPYDGSGTKTAQALQHARDVVLAPSNGNRAGARDVILLVTDGKSQDDVEEIGAQLRRDGVVVFVLPIKPPGKGSIDLNQVRSIATSEDKLIKGALEGGFEALDKEFSQTVSNIICGNPCDHVLLHQDEL